MTTSTEEGGDPQTTNLYVGNLAPQVQHRTAHAHLLPCFHEYDEQGVCFVA